MSKWKLPRDPRTGNVSGAMVASWCALESMFDLGLW